MRIRNQGLGCDGFSLTRVVSCREGAGKPKGNVFARLQATAGAALPMPAGDQSFQDVDGQGSEPSTHDLASLEASHSMPGGGRALRLQVRLYARVPAGLWQGSVCSG